MLIAYDPNGTYGHPDHIQVHRVGILAAEKAGTGRVYQATANREADPEGLRSRPRVGVRAPGGPAPGHAGLRLSRTDVITTAVDVSAFLDRKRAAMGRTPARSRRIRSS